VADIEMKAVLIGLLLLFNSLYAYSATGGTITTNATQARLSERQVRYIERRSIAGRVPSAEQLRWGN
jgi:hypothetical protein